MTPCVARPDRLMSSADMRMTVPPSEISITAYPSRTIRAPASFPFASTSFAVLHAHPAAALHRVLGDARALAPAVLGDDEQVRVVLRDVDLDHLVLAAQPHALDARRGAAHRRARPSRGTGSPGPSAETMSTSSDPSDEPHADQLVVLAHLDRDDPVRLERRVVGGELRLLDHALPRREDEVLRLLEVARRDHGAHVLVLPEGEQVHDRAALRLARPERQLVHLQPVDLADGREEEDVVVRRGDEEVLDVVVLLHVHAHHADAAAPLLAVRRHR